MSEVRLKKLPKSFSKEPDSEVDNFNLLVENKKTGKQVQVRIQPSCE